MPYTTLQFNRIAEYVVLKSLRQILIDSIGFPADNIHFNNPSNEYTNTRTETTSDPNKEEIRYPSLAIYSRKDFDISGLNTYDYQSDNVLDVDNKIKFYESTYRNMTNYDFVLETTTKQDFYLWKHKLRAFFEEYKRGFVALNDTLPNKPLMVSMQTESSVDDTMEKPFATLFNVKLYYLIHYEYLANTFQEFELHGSIFNNNNVQSIDDDTEDFTYWLNDNPYPDL